MYWLQAATQSFSFQTQYTTQAHQSVCSTVAVYLISMVECELRKNSLNNFICHLSWLKKLSPAHTHPLISIHEFLIAYELLFFELIKLIFE